MTTTQNEWVQSGFTIIEVMIFLAASGLMFVMAAVFISGKQADVAYRQGMASANVLIRSEVNSVANGEFDSNGGFTCLASGSRLLFSGAGVSQGQNKGCVFMGKVLQFGTSSDNTQYKSYVVAGNQFTGPINNGIFPNTPANFSQAYPVAVTGAGVGGQNLTTVSSLEWGLSFKSAFRCSGNCNSRVTQQKIGGVGFFGSFGSYQGISQVQSGTSGAQNVFVVALPTVANPDDMVNNISALNDGSVLKAGEYVILCFNRGNKVGSITLGGPNGQSTSTTLNYNGVSQCVN